MHQVAGAGHQRAQAIRGRDPTLRIVLPEASADDEESNALTPAELAAFLQDGPSAQELEQGKLLFRNILTGVSDSSASIAKFVFTSLVRYNEIAQPQQDVEMLESISREEILDVMRRLQLSCSCRLTGKAGD